MKNIIVTFSILLFWGCSKKTENKVDAIAVVDTIKDEIPIQENVSSEKIPTFSLDKIDTIINFKENYSIKISLCDSIQFDDSKETIKTIDSDFVKIYKKGLQLKLKDGTWKQFLPDKRVDELEFAFKNYFADFGYYLFETYIYEGSGFRLVNDSTGADTYIIGEPYFSPNGQSVISINEDLEAGFSANGLELFLNNKDRLQNLGFFEPELWGPTNVKWIDNETFILKNKTSDLNVNNEKAITFFTKVQILKK